jgi:hypothetical protein
MTLHYLPLEGNKRAPPAYTLEPIGDGALRMVASLAVRKLSRRLPLPLSVLSEHARLNGLGSELRAEEVV